MKRVLFTACVGFLCLSAAAQISFSNGGFLLGDATINSGVSMGLADMNGDGLNDLVRLDNGRRLSIEYQQADGSQFVEYVYGYMSPYRQWGMAIADMDNDGINDVVIGGSNNENLRIFQCGQDSIIDEYFLPNPKIFLQAINFADINNDGWVDIFACDDDGLSPPFRNDGNNSWTYDISLINTASPNPSDNSGNYGSVWTDYDLDGDLDLYISKCRGGVSDPLDGRRTNLLFENDGSNNFSEVAAAVGLRPGAQSWATDFADIDNDGDLDAFIVNHDSISQLYENIGNQFVNITNTSGMVSELNNFNTGIQAKFGDFDNDGYVDLMVTGASKHYMFRNNGDKTFTAVSAFPAGTPDIHSLSVGDMDNDGFLDMITGYANGFNTPSNTPDRLYMNDGNDNNWSKIQLVGTSSNRGGVGARLELYGNWGRQIREVRGGEGYGIATSLETHFGIGADSTIDSLVVLWPSGATSVICDPEPNITHVVREGCNPFCGAFTKVIQQDICAGDGYSITVGGVIFNESNPSGSVLLPGATASGCDSTVTVELSVETVDVSVGQSGNTLTAAAGMEYQWLDCGNGNAPIAGENGQSFTPAVDGSYAVVVTNDKNCSDTSDCVDIIGTAVIDAVFDFEVNVFPNPTSGNLFIQFGKVLDEAEFRIYSVHGATVLEDQIYNRQSIQLNLASLAPGSYVLEIRHDNRTGVMQLIRQ